MYYLLIALIFLLFLASLKVFDFDLLHPVTGAVAIFLFSALEGLLQYKEFQYSDFTASAVFHIMLGLVSYAVASYLAQILYKKWEIKRSKKMVQDTTTLEIERPQEPFQRYQRIDLPIIFLLICILFVFWCCYASYHYMENYVIQQCGEGDYTMSQILGIFRSFTTDAAYETNPPKYLGISQRLVELGGVFCFFTLAYNICLCKVHWKDVFYFAGACSWIAETLLQSNRGTFLTMLSLLTYLFYYFLKMRNGWKKRVDIIMGVAACIVLVLFMFVFLQLRIILGRGSAMTREQNLYYLTIYINGGIRDFDIYLRNPTFPAVPGSELFYGIYKSLHVFFNIGDNIVPHLEFVSLNGVTYSNIFTAFRRFYTAGKEVGIIVWAGLQGVIYTIGYLINRSNLKKGKVIFNVILFSYFSNAIFYLPVTDMFYMACFSIGVPARILLMYLIYFVLFRKQLNRTAVATK